jgi:hypothetical protein
MGRSKSPHTMFSYYVPLIVVTVAAPVADETTSISTVLVPPVEPTAIITSFCFSSLVALLK